MRFELQQTASGPTVFDTSVLECFKSRHSAHQECLEVFLRPGVIESPLETKNFRILELGFGLGTNFKAWQQSGISGTFTSIEKDLSGLEFFLRHFPDEDLEKLLVRHIWESGKQKAQIFLNDFETQLSLLAVNSFEAIFFDPFSPKSNPDCWNAKIFQLCFDLLVPQGRLVTYSVSRAAKDSARNAGFLVQKRDLSPELRKRSSLVAIEMEQP